jgi:F-type H+-transporting ATPase subunit delta
MVNVSVARRYARALFELSEARSDQLLEQLGALAAVFSQNHELDDLVRNPAYTRAQRIGVVEAVMAKLDGLDPALANLVRLLVERSRLQYLPDIARLYRDQADLKAGRVRGKVLSARPLSSEGLAQIGQQLERTVQRDVVLEAQVDPSLLGGVSAQVGSVIYDGSLRTQLNELRRTLQSR